MKKKTNIACLIHSLQPGGMERVMSVLLSEFSKNEEVTLYLLLYGIKRETFYSIPSSVKVIQPSFSFDNSKRILYTMKTGLFIRNSIKEINPDSILSFGEIWNSFVLFSLFGLKYPVFISDRNQPGKSLGKINDFIRKKLYPFSAGIIAQTRVAKDIYLSEFKHSNIKVIGNPIRQISSSVTEEKEKIILSVGRLIDSKHHDKLIETFVNVRVKGWKLYIIGGDALRQENHKRLEQLIVSLNAKEYVKLLGSRSDVDSFYQISRLFAFTSSSEGFPNVIGEALSASIPVVSFDCVAGPSEMVINEHNGYLVKLFDYKEFGLRLKILMENDRLREQYSKNASNSVEKFNKQKLALEFYGFITSGA